MKNNKLEFFKIIPIYQGKPYVHKKYRIYESKKQFKLNYINHKKWVDTLNGNNGNPDLFGLKCYKLVYDIKEEEFFWLELTETDIKIYL